MSTIEQVGFASTTPVQIPQEAKTYQQRVSFEGKKDSFEYSQPKKKHTGRNIFLTILGLAAAAAGIGIAHNKGGLKFLDKAADKWYGKAGKAVSETCGKGVTTVSDFAVNTWKSIFKKAPKA